MLGSINFVKHLACSTWYRFSSDTITKVYNLEGTFGKLATSQHHPGNLEFLNEIVDCHLKFLKNSSIMYNSCISIRKRKWEKYF